MPRVTLAGRYVNDSMGRYVAERTLSLIRLHDNQDQPCESLDSGYYIQGKYP